MRNRTTTALLYVAIGLSVVTGCTGKTSSTPPPENAELRAELEEVKMELKLLRREVNIAISAATNYLQISKTHSQLIENMNTQLDTISDAMVHALNTEMNREKTKLLR